VVCAPCGFGLEQSTSLAEELVAAELLPRDVAVWAVDANASFARPGPRLVDGVEALAGILHQDVVAPSTITRRVR
jgi:iron complex transport system substrate-binding protein